MATTATATTKGPRRHLFIDLKLPDHVADRSSHRRLANYMQKSRRPPRMPGSISDSSRRRQIKSDVQLLQPFGRNWRRSVHQEILRLLVHRERNDLAKVRRVRQQPDDAVDAGCHAPMRRRAVFEGVEHTGKARFHLFGGITGYRKRLVHDVRAVVADRPRRQLGPVANYVVLMCRYLQRILPLEHREATLRHREGVVAEFDLAGFLVALVHWKIGDPTELEQIVLGEAQLAAELEPCCACESEEILRDAAYEKHRIAIAESELRPDAFAPFRSKSPADRAGAFALAKEDVAEPGLPLGLGPGIDAVAEGPIPAAWSRDRPHPSRGIRSEQAGEYPEPGIAEMLGHVLHFQRIAEVGLVGAVFAHRLRVRNAEERRQRYRPSAAEFLEHAAHHRLDRSKDILLRHEGHLQIELIMLARRAVGAARLVPEAWRDLKIAVEPGNQ